MRFIGQRQSPDTYSSWRHALVSRRAVLKYGVAAGAGVAVAACGSGSSMLEDVSIAVDTTSPATTTSETSGAPASTGSVTSTVPPTDAPAPASTDAPTTTAPGSEPIAIANGAEMVVSFTYQQQAGGKNESPYLAVWIEGADGELVHTIALWFQQDRKGPRWLPDLKRWYSVDQSRIQAGGTDSVDAISGPTRLPGQHAVAWDGRSEVLDATPAGDYFVCIESAREKGPYSLIREPVRLVGQALELALPDDTELVAASVSVS